MIYIIYGDYKDDPVGDVDESDDLCWKYIIYTYRLAPHTGWHQK